MCLREINCEGRFNMCSHGRKWSAAAPLEGEWKHWFISFGMVREIRKRWKMGAEMEAKCETHKGIGACLRRQNRQQTVHSDPNSSLEIKLLKQEVWPMICRCVGRLAVSSDAISLWVLDLKWCAASLLSSTCQWCILRGLLSRTPPWPKKTQPPT